MSKADLLNLVRSGRTFGSRSASHRRKPAESNSADANWPAESNSSDANWNSLEPNAASISTATKKDPEGIELAALGVFFFDAAPKTVGVNSTNDGVNFPCLVVNFASSMGGAVRKTPTVVGRPGGLEADVVNCSFWA